MMDTLLLQLSFPAAVTAAGDMQDLHKEGLQDTDGDAPAGNLTTGAAGSRRGGSPAVHRPAVGRSRSPARSGASITTRLLKTLWSDEAGDVCASAAASDADGHDTAIDDVERVSFSFVLANLNANEASSLAAVTAVGSDADVHDAAPISESSQDSFASALANVEADEASLPAAVTAVLADGDGQRTAPIPESSQDSALAEQVFSRGPGSCSSSPTPTSPSSPLVEFSSSRLGEVYANDNDYRSSEPPASLMELWERGSPSNDGGASSAQASLPPAATAGGHTLYYQGPAAASLSTTSVNLPAALQHLIERVDANELPIFCDRTIIDDDDASVEALMLQIASRVDIGAFYVGVTTDPVHRWRGGPTERGWMPGHGEKYCRMDILAVRGPGCAASLETLLITSARTYNGSFCQNKALDSRGGVRSAINFLYIVS